MAKLLILEGARTGGKSTLARYMRENLKSSTLINMTGYPEDGENGLDKIVSYYSAFINYITGLNNDHTFILDRMFISEMVFSKLYKSYDFTPYFEMLLKMMSDYGKHEIHVFWLPVDRKLVEERLKREKTDHFSFSDSVDEILKQNSTYNSVLGDMYKRFYFNGVDRHFHVIDPALPLPEQWNMVKDKLQIS